MYFQGYYYHGTCQKNMVQCLCTMSKNTYLMFSFSFHLYLCVCFSLLAMVLYRVPLKWSRWWCKLTHAGLLFVAVLLSMLGVHAAFHTANNIPHLYLLHSWTGTSTVALFTLQVQYTLTSLMMTDMSQYLHCFTLGKAP